MRAVGAVGGEREHLRAERGEQPRRPARGLHRAIDGVRRIHPVEVVAHEGQRSAVVLAADVEQRLVRDADAEHEAVRVGLAERELARGGGEGVAGPDVRDTGCDDEGSVADSSS